jgi:hypothetical protein
MPVDLTKERYPIPREAGSPARKAFAITPSDVAELSTWATFLYIGTAGDLTVTPVGNSADTGILYADCPAGWVPVQVRKVWDTGTDATDIVGHSD